MDSFLYFALMKSGVKVKRTKAKINVGLKAQNFNTLQLTLISQLQNSFRQVSYSWSFLWFRGSFLSAEIWQDILRGARTVNNISLPSSNYCRKREISITPEILDIKHGTIKQMKALFFTKIKNLTFFRQNTPQLAIHINRTLHVLVTL